MHRPPDPTDHAQARRAPASPEFLLLGQLEVRRGGRLLTPEPVKQRMILAKLLLRPNQPVATETLIDTIWGPGPPPTVRAILHNQILRLRRILEPDPTGKPQVLCTSRPGYLVRVDPQRLDLARFEALAQQGRRALSSGDAAGAATRLRQALSLWRGPLLADLTPALTAEWPELTVIEQLRATVLEARIEADLLLGRIAEVMDELRVLLHRDPLRPRLHGLLMMALCRSDRQAEAFTIYRESSGVLARELGYPPLGHFHITDSEVVRTPPA